ncbi:MAG TPA: PfkB family carbohydrate kinase [Opitutaceae bacterium]|nr:PfkB family carbohydrate kinase [Opitutaceae bacterium]
MTTTAPHAAREALAKTLAFEDAPAVMDDLRAQGLRIVQCHGTFDLVHPGHIVHFEEARALGDILVVTITAAAHVNKGPGRPFFDDTLRVKALTALTVVDYVVVVPFPAAVEAIDCIRPHVYCKGKEYEEQKNDVTGNIRDDVAAVARVGGEIRYVGSVVFSSTRLINNQFSVLPQETRDFCRKLSEIITPPEFVAAVDDFSQLKVLVVGDVIFDRYTKVHVQGLTSKNRTISVRQLAEETHLGGALAVYRHIRAFTEHVDFFSITGTEAWVPGLVAQAVPAEHNLGLRLENFTTVIKQRFIEQSKRTTEVNKLFALNFIDARGPNGDTEARLCRALAGIIADYDLVVVADFGHGLMQPRVRELVQERASYLALNCQTNSNNHGFNVIDRQYHRADAFTLDEEELTLACGQRYPEPVPELGELRRRFGSAYGWLTRGGHETIGTSASGAVFHMPVLEQQVTDTVGAGDAVFSLCALSARAGLPLHLATFLGQLAGAQKVRVMGNAEGVRKDRLLKGGIALLSY